MAFRSGILCSQSIIDPKKIKATGDAILAESVAKRDTTCFAKRLGHKNLIVDGYSSEVVKAICSVSTEVVKAICSVFKLLVRRWKILGNNPNLSRRYGNRVAHNLDKNAFFFNDSNIRMDVAP